MSLIIKKKLSTVKPYFDIFGPCKLLLVVDASSYSKFIILLIIVELIVPRQCNITIKSSSKEIS